MILYFFEYIVLPAYVLSYIFFKLAILQVKDQISHIEGADVIQHMIDHFLT